MAIPPKHRYLELDLLRTAAILLMVVYHAAFDLSVFFDVPLDPLSGGWLILQRITANLFLLLVGMSFAVSYGRMEAREASRKEIYGKYGRRGFSVILCAMLVTLVTFVALGDMYIRFGVLHLIGTGIIILPFVMPLREGNVLLAALIFLIGTMTGTAPDGFGSFLLPMGWIPPGFQSADYFPIVPWMGTILIGTAVGNLLYNRGWLRWHLPDHRLTRIVTEPGRHALVIYLVHQPVLLLVLWLVVGRG